MGVGRPGALGGSGLALAGCSAVAGGAESAAARASGRSCVCRRGWGACPRGSVPAGAFGCRLSPGLISLKRGAGGKPEEANAPFAAPELGRQEGPPRWVL